MKTADLIKDLSTGLKPAKGGGFFRQWMLLFVLATAAIAGLAYYVLPLSPDISVRAQKIQFWVESALWLLAFAVAAGIAYRSAIPGISSIKEQTWGILLLAALGIMILARIPSADPGAELLSEMHLYRGNCGLIILIVAALEGSVFLLLARKAAPTHLALTGAWIAVSASCLGIFLMQFICVTDAGIHILIWHVVPMMLLAILGSWLGRRLLRW